MAKKKSKTQKRKINNKKKVNSISKNNSGRVVDASKVTSITSGVIDQEKKKNIITQNSSKVINKNSNQKDSFISLEKKGRKMVSKDQVIYNVFQKKEDNNRNKDLKNIILSIFAFLKKYFLLFICFFKKIFTFLKNKISLLFKKIKRNKVTDFNNKRKIDKKKNKKDSKNRDTGVIVKEKVKRTKWETFKFILKSINSYLHVVFNTLLIIIFVVLIIGLKKVGVFSQNFIVYIGCIVGFLCLVAISYNKYMSGRIFSIIIGTLMVFGIIQLNYTYDFINALNTAEYEYKEYYVVAFDNGLNKSIYNINNKKVALYDSNTINIERFLNTKLDKVTYIPFIDQDKMFESFYNSEFRAVVVNDNQYKYLVNNVNNNQKVKILYKFKVNAHK